MRGRILVSIYKILYMILYHKYITISMLKLISIKIISTNNENTIIENYQNSTFSVIIPKTITLNGNTYKGSYNIKVNGTFYYNDTLTITPNNSFLMIDKNNILKLQANVTQNTTSFNKNNLGNVNGFINLNKNGLAGTYNGIFNFNIKFVMKN